MVVVVVVAAVTATVELEDEVKTRSKRSMELSEANRRVALDALVDGVRRLFVDFFCFGSVRIAKKKKKEKFTGKRKDKINTIEKEMKVEQRIMRGGA